MSWQRAGSCSYGKLAQSSSSARHSRGHWLGFVGTALSQASKAKQRRAKRIRRLYSWRPAAPRISRSPRPRRRRGDAPKLPPGRNRGPGARSRASWEILPAVFDRIARLLERPLEIHEPFAVRDAIVVLGAPLGPDGALSPAVLERV